jgi:hypothetical protein
MRITIDSDDKGKLNIQSSDKGINKPGSFESTSDIPVIDAGSAPVQELQRTHKVSTAAEGESAAMAQSPQEREAQLPLNPLRAGAAAAYQNPANVRSQAADYEGTPAAQHQSMNTMDGGSAKIAKDKQSSGAPTREPQPSGKRDKKR